MKYKILETYYNKLGDNHIPYFIAAIVKGPRGGIYLVDEFSLEQLFKYNKYMDKSKIYERIDEKVSDVPKNYITIRGGRVSDDVFNELYKRLTKNNSNIKINKVQRERYFGRTE